ncbi:MAG: TatD family hydrolase [Actinomycetia bacterium]|nr:TatD family hydrolase [Actinomycetes bacterium]MCP4961217.1 TatD family hydrolase [Actinomycetes bacterium]
MTTWIDNHCHLPDDPDLAAEQVAEAVTAGVGRLVDVGTDVESSRTAIARAERFEIVSATAGIHPHVARHGIDGLADLLAHPQVRAVGETGLDFYYDNSPRREQKLMFEAQIELAHAYDLPLVIHSRNAWPETFEVLDAVGVPERAVLHCFTGGPAEAEKALDRGMVLSFSGIVTFPSATELAQAAVLCPLDAMMIETDSPYLAPVPHRGTKNRPAHVVAVGEHIAHLLGAEVDVIAEATSRRAHDFYSI